LLDIPAGEVHMGTTEDKQFPSAYVEIALENLAEYSQNDNYLEDFFSGWTSRAARASRDERQPQLVRAVEQFKLADNDQMRLGAAQRLLRSFHHFGNEYSVDRVVVKSHSIGRKSLTNEFVRLFDSSWGLRSRDMNYARYSKTKEHPSIGVNFFRAWAIAQWLLWDGLACRLPWEHEWEYVAKYGLPMDCWHQSYWWGDEFDADKANTSESDGGATLIADSQRASAATKQLDAKGAGVMDMLGNHWEWCQDAYRFHYWSQQPDDRLNNPFVSRVLRGGSFDGYPRNARCSFRYLSVPADADHYFGVRVARARKS